MHSDKYILSSPWRDSIVALDCETTGLDPTRDAILEIGMVRFEHGEPIERYHRVFDPGIPVPHAVTLLTGISSQECQQGAPLSFLLPEIFEFLQNAWIVGHRIDFDLAFLFQAWKKWENPLFSFVPSRYVIDTDMLSRILLPWASNHRLETIAQELGISVRQSHRALADAEIAGHVFFQLLPRILELDTRVREIILRILDGAEDGLRFVFSGIPSSQEENAILIKKNPCSFNVLGELPSDSEQKSLSSQLLDLQSAEKYFGENGILAQSIPGYEFRKSQLEMASAVIRAFNQDAFLIVEAGTGVGKSLAYLIPSVLWVTQNPKEKIVIATHTKTLQDQLFYKDLPLVRQLINQPFLAVLLKGRNNYLCLARFYHLLSHLDTLLSPMDRRKLLPLVLWAFETQTGDIEENVGFAREANVSLWSLLHSESRICSGMQCPFYESECFVQTLYRKSRLSHLIIVNHALLFASLNNFRSVLGNAETLIIDEAHHIEKVASQHLGVCFTLTLFLDFLHWIYRSHPHELGWIVSVKQVLKRSKVSKEIENEGNHLLSLLKTIVLELEHAVHRFFRHLEVLFDSLRISNDIDSSRRVRILETFGTKIPESFDALESGLKTLKSTTLEILSLLQKQVPEDPHTENQIETLYGELAWAIEKIDVFLEMLSGFREPDFEKEVVWIETNIQGEKREMALHKVPIEVGPLLASRLYPRIKRGVLTSATLTIGESFDYVVYRWGFQWVDSDRRMTKALGSTFDFSKQMKLAVTTFLPNPKEDTLFAKELSELLQRVLIMYSRNTLILFTSYSLLKSVYSAIRGPLEEKGIWVLAQGLDGPRSVLLRLFQMKSPSVLLGTSSFWEGIDLPGSLLELLIIPKIPFDVPTDPLVQARMEKIHADTGNGFLNYFIPEAIIRLRQGLGRLIRSREDQGVVLFLDKRLCSAPYGPLFFHSFPVEPEICEAPEALFSILEESFNQKLYNTVRN